MPTYDVRCRACGDTFEVVRPMAQINDPAPCPNGHDDTVRLLTTVSITRGGQPSGDRSSSVRSSGGAPAGGGCCGGSCCG